ncbi:MAG: hypothetical protein EBT65_06460 [Actinobacteria bacterium]|nr:hypothetical protein [Actinomycetota bacterium]
MPSVKELYKKLSDIKIDANSVNLNTDGLESLLATTQADIALIKADIANGVLSDVRDGSGNAITSSARGSQRALSVQIVDGSGNQVTSFGSSSVSVSNFPATQTISGTVAANTGLTQPLTDTQLRATSVAVNLPSSSTASISTFTAATSSTVLSASATRKGVILYSFNTGSSFVSLGDTTTTTSNYSFVLGQNDIVSITGYNGIITGIVNGSANLQVTSLS